MRYSVRRPVTIEIGASQFFTASGLTELRGLRRDLTFGYTMVTVAF